MLAGFSCFMFTMGIVIAAWMDFMAHLFHVRIRGTVMGLSFFGSSLAGTAGALASGWMIRHLPAPASYAWLYCGAWALGTLSLLMWLFVHDPAATSHVDPPLPRFRDILLRFRASLRDLNFRAFLIGRVLAACGFCIIPFVAVYYTSAVGGSLPKDMVVSSYAALSVGMALGSLVLGRLGDRRGHWIGILIGTGMQVAALAIILCVPGLPGCLLAYAAAGVCNAAGFVSHYNLIIESCPHDNRIAHISVANLIIGAPLAVVPILAGRLADAWGLRVLFGACLAVSVIAFAWLLLRVRDPRRLAAWVPELELEKHADEAPESR